ncbi:sporulation-delaying protein SdpB family protein [Kutzneria kofuensis]|uniref:Antimicrobial peptide system SdpB family protein n=1 Tax=Kutzneria kofuensis TaxID=103725 RepID=A0A7W9KP14_9PSEU|nr:sporulation-delaying protein SdpB family protein [Kutzneria kofuensis]MBB5896072.1 antimicrobial peptide system SdpB family protein [Kutzneria kofuensis]
MLTRLLEFEPRTRLLGVGRSLVAVAELLTLLFTTDPDLFPGVDDAPTGPQCGAGLRTVTLWCLNSGAVGQTVARYLAIAVLVAVAVGYRPRWTCIPHWYVSFSFAAALVSPTGGEHIAKIVALLLIPILLGDDRTWHWTRPSTPMSPRWRGAAAASHLAVRALVLSVYAQSAVSKFAEAAWRDGSALHYVFQDPYFGATPSAAAFLDGVGPVMTWATLAAETFLALSVFAGDRVRAWALAVGIVLHTGIAVVLGLVGFGLTMIGLLSISALLRDRQPAPEPVP